MARNWSPPHKNNLIPITLRKYRCGALCAMARQKMFYGNCKYQDNIKLKTKEDFKFKIWFPLFSSLFFIYGITSLRPFYYSWHILVCCLRLSLRVSLDDDRRNNSRMTAKITVRITKVMVLLNTDKTKWYNIYVEWKWMNEWIITL